MKRSFNTLFITALIVLIAAPAFAQNRQGMRGGERGQRGWDRGDRMERVMQDVSPELRSEAHLAVLDKYVNLTPDQENQIVTADEEFAAKGEELREAPMNRQRKAVAAADLKKEHQLAIYDILTKEQYRVFLVEREAIRIEVREYIQEQLDD
ncbi:MAG: hypothetical protein MI700_12605 [Balneolales bacterium]|nr:hypothetical protein [Balneolales bacterium]